MFNVKYHNVFCFAFCLAWCIGFFTLVNAQPQVSAKLDTNFIKIGDQTSLRLSATLTQKEKGIWFAVPDTFNTIEVILRDTIDTIASANGFLLSQRIVITSFDSGLHTIPPLYLRSNLDSSATGIGIGTQPIMLGVQTIPVDTTKAIKDIKGVIDVPFDIMDYIWYIVGAIALVVLAGVLIYFLRKRKLKPVVLEKKIPTRPAHEIAFEKLNELKEQKLWQQGNYKQYHTQLTDIMRQYLEHRYRINAMEFTSDEIMQSSTIQQLAATDNIKLREMLTLADLVKFAKTIPIGGENERSMTDAFDFIKSTMQVQVANATASNNQNNGNQQ
ncbi:MAG: hypothetical protein IPO27_02130 [Bacteroidetes bacterium]|nr:hypothetical protein [Bacteroidota bacterium]